jgi:hypothetical protein
MSRIISPVIYIQKFLNFCFYLTICMNFFTFIYLLFFRGLHMKPNIFSSLLGSMSFSHVLREASHKVDGFTK